MSSDVIIRRARPGDLGGVARLVAAWRDSLPRLAPDDRAIERGLGRMLDDPAVMVGLAVAGAAVVGYSLQRRHFSVWAEGDEALLEDLFVAAGARGRGTGRRLVEHAVEHARVAGCRSVRLDANEHNAAAGALCRRLGFQCEREHWAGGRQLRHDLRLETAAPAEPGLRWGAWMVRW